MKLDAVLIADAVSTPPDGKFYVHGGGYSRIEVPGLPAPIPVSVLVRFVVEEGEDEAEHRFRITLIGPAGIPNVHPVEGQAFPPSHESAQDLVDGEQQYLNVALEIPAVAVRAGLYRLQVELDGDLVKEVPFPVLVAEDTDTGISPAPPKPKRRKKPPPPPRKRQKRRR